MKTAYYVATVIRAYRAAIDAYYNDPENWKFDPTWMEELKKGSHRHYTTGFYEKKPDTEDQNYASSSYIRNYDFVGIVRRYDETTGLATVEQRNKMVVGDEIEVIGPYIETMNAKIEKIYNEEGEEIESAPHPRQIVKLKLDIKVEENYMLRREIGGGN
jgi:putative protease